ncbi:MAG: hypothetical protein LAN62_03600 [Acidobacteriia bacterium]|nr:hypothetical protein [Terriglobia bacterium]
MEKITLSLNTVAQGLHASLGALSVALPGWLWGNRAALIGGISAAVFAAVKESWFDPRYEDEATAGSGLEDFAFWGLGILAAGILHFLVNR